MDEYISREETLKAFKLIAKNPNKDYQRGMQDTIDCLVPEVIADIPSADVQPARYGRWENEYLEDDIWWAECSNCKQETHSRYGRPSTYRYCPNCGARMDLEDGDAE